MSERDQQVAEIVKLVLDVEPTARAASLDERCPPELREDVESLLSFEQRQASSIERPAAQLGAHLVAHGATLIGRRIEQYELLEHIGSGGMGEVYLAGDTILKRRVALKLVHGGVVSEAMRRRFGSEAQILAALNHPNIAHLYGSGISDHGTPFVALEYVEGTRIDEFCDRAALKVRERLQLFIKVCRAVSYAHQRLVIHRDLKPSNILVTANGEPKLLDFGIAKLLDPETAAATEATMTFERVMTPEYASPEQMRGEAVTTATDVYSLGVILYELLTRQKPYRVGSRAPDEITRAITTQTPARPSAVAATEPKLLRGDIDNIVLMAIRKEPERRYGSVQQLADDIASHLDGRPVSARGDSLGYRASKFIVRNRIAVAAAVVVFLAIIGGLVATISQARTAARQRDLARVERQRAERINAFLQRMLSFSNQSITSISPVAQRRDVTVNEMLDQIVPQVDRELASDPEVRARILRTIGSAYASRGIFGPAERTLRTTLDLQLRLHGDASVETAATRTDLGVLMYRQGRLAEADAMLSAAAAAYGQLGNRDPARHALALDHLGVVKFFRGNPREAEQLLRSALHLSSRSNLAPDEHWVVAYDKADLGGLLAYTGHAAEGETLLREAIAQFRTDGGRPRWELGNCLTLLGTAVAAAHRHDEALRYLTEGEAILRDTLGNDNGYHLNNLEEQAKALRELHEFAAAEEKVRAAVDVARKLPAPNELFVATALKLLGDVQWQAGRGVEAQAALAEASKLRGATPSPPAAEKP